MPNEMSKANPRRLLSKPFSDRWFVGSGLDIGCGPDKLNADLWPRIDSVTGYDKDRADICGDAQFLSNVPDNDYDFVVSAHCLEHLHDTLGSLHNWIRVVKPGGYLIITIPDWELYEHRQWPSRYNGDHKRGFTLEFEEAIVEDKILIYVPSLLYSLRREVDIELLHRITDYYDWEDTTKRDQTGGLTECAIEMVLRKK